MKWETFGMHLLQRRDKAKLTLIRQKCGQGSTLLERCKDLLEEWKRTIGNPEWQQVITALREVDLNTLATQLEKALKSKSVINESKVFAIL